MNTKVQSRNGQIQMGNLFTSVFFTLNLFAVVFGGETKTPEDILIKVSEKYAAHESISYAVDYNRKHFSSDDTTSWKADCQLIRVKEDTVFGGYIYFKTFTEYSQYYDLELIYGASPTQGRITTYKAHHGETWGITGHVIGNVIETYFFDEGKLKAFAEDSLNTLTIKNEKVIDEKYWVISISFPDKEPISNQVTEFWILNENLTITKIKKWAEFQGDIQFNEWTLTNIKFDSFSVDQFQNKLQDQLSKYIVEPYEPKPPSYYDLIESGSIVPDFKGEHIQEGIETKLYDLNSEIVILDFWYMSCYPCIKAIPHLNELFLKYEQNEVMVWGINSKDLDEKDRKRLPTFINKNNMDYPAILTSPKTDSLYNVHAYPTIYAVNKNKEVIFSQIGFSESLTDTLTNLIEKTLEK